MADTAKVGSYGAGIFVGVGWWIFLDGALMTSKIPFNFLKCSPGIISTIAFFLLTSLDWGMVSNPSNYNGTNVGCRSRSLVIFCGLLFGVSITMAIVILSKTYAGNMYGASTWPGIAIVLQTIAIFLGGLVMRIATIP